MQAASRAEQDRVHHATLVNLGEQLLKHGVQKRHALELENAVHKFGQDICSLIEDSDNEHGIFNLEIFVGIGVDELRAILGIRTDSKEVPGRFRNISHGWVLAQARNAQRAVDAYVATDPVLKSIQAYEVDLTHVIRSVGPIPEKLRVYMIQVLQNIYEGERSGDKYMCDIGLKQLDSLRDNGAILPEIILSERTHRSLLFYPNLKAVIEAERVRQDAWRRRHGFLSFAHTSACRPSPDDGEEREEGQKVQLAADAEH